MIWALADGSGGHRRRGAAVLSAQRTTPRRAPMSATFRFGAFIRERERFL